MKINLRVSVFLFYALFVLPVFSQVYKVDVNKIYSWDAAAMPADWQQDITEQYIYGNGGNKETNLLRLTFPAMENVYQHIKTYNTNNDIDKDVFQTWNPSPPGSWVNSSQTLYFYDTSNYLIDVTKQMYVSGTTYVNDERDLFEYSGANAIKQTNQSWDGANWVNVEKIDVTYTSGLPTLALYSLWDSVTTMDWFAPYEQDTATYIGSLLDQLNTVNFDTGELDRSIYTYASGLLTELLFEEWDGANWIPFDRELSTYDANDNNTVLIFEDNNTGPWVGYSKEERSFSVAAPLSTESFENQNFMVFPNPASDIINISSSIDIEKIEIFDILGKQVLKSSETKRLSVENLKSGMYLLKVFNKNANVTKKIVVK